MLQYFQDRTVKRKGNSRPFRNLAIKFHFSFHAVLHQVVQLIVLRVLDIGQDILDFSHASLLQRCQKIAHSCPISSPVVLEEQRLVTLAGIQDSQWGDPGTGSKHKWLEDWFPGIGGSSEPVTGNPGSWQGGHMAGHHGLLVQFLSSHQLEHVREGEGALGRWRIEGERGFSGPRSWEWSCKVKTSASIPNSKTLSLFLEIRRALVDLCGDIETPRRRPKALWVERGRILSRLPEEIGTLTRNLLCCP